LSLTRNDSGLYDDVFHVIVYRNSTVQKWHDKTHLMSSKVGKGFDAFDQSVLKQIQQVMFAEIILCDDF